MLTKAERIYIRVDADQKALIEAASRVADTNVSSFVLGAAMSSAATALADRRTFNLDARGWAAFDAALSRPARDIAGLRDLLTSPTTLDPDH
jgi:uncharacterized protein (DUF1778 family)